METQSKDKIYWHGAFFEAIQLEFHQYLEALTFVYEHPLSKEELLIDVLVIRKEQGIEIEKNIGKIFKAINLFEITMVGLIQTHHCYFYTNKPQNHRNKGFRWTRLQQRKPFCFVLMPLPYPVRKVQNRNFAPTS